MRETAIEHGVAPGIHTSSAAAVNQRIAEGFQFCAMASELRYLLAGLNQDIAALVQKSGLALFMTSRLDGKVVLRFAIARHGRNLLAQRSR